MIEYLCKVENEGGNYHFAVLNIMMIARFFEKITSVYMLRGNAEPQRVHCYRECGTVYIEDLKASAIEHY